MHIYDLTIPVFDRFLGNLSRLLEQGERFSRERGKDPGILTDARLAPAMYPLSSQVHVVTDTAKGCAARLAGQEVPRWQDTEQSFEELKARIERTQTYLATFDRDNLAGADKKQIIMRFAGRAFDYTGQEYVKTVALPNFYFHVSLTYAILRNQGLQLGKFDYLGEF